MTSVSPEKGVSSPKSPNSPAPIVADEKLENRDKWGSKLDFILSCLGYAVGLGNVWRFPYLCGRSGGAVFLIPYFIMMIFAGLPTFYLELAIGQYAALTPHILYRRMCPIFAGIGYAMITISVFTGIYYNMIIAWSMYYFVMSFTSSLPWEYCTNWWNTEYCFDDRIARTCDNVTTVYYRGTCYNATEFNDTMLTNVYKFHWGDKIVTSADEYLNKRVLNLSTGLHDIGIPNWELVVALFAAWVLVFFCLIKGIKTSGKVVYFTATFPYVILVILLIRGVTLDGAWDGIKYYMVPKYEKLFEASVWGDAAVQIFFSLSLGGGGLTTLASYNEFHNNILRDTLIVVFGNCGTSIFAGFVIFPILGFVSKQLKRPVAKIAAQGPTLAFVAYPGALSRLPGAPFWAILFFFMLVILGIDSQLVIVEVVITCIIDQWPQLRPWKKKMAVVGSVCTISFLLGLILTCPGGPYVLNLMDTFAGGWPLVMACWFEVCMVSYVYGWRRFLRDIRLMLGVAPNGCWRTLGYPVNPYWCSNWVVITPLLLLLVLLFNWVTFGGASYGDYKYPAWGNIVGWGFALACVMWIPVIAIIMAIFAALRQRDWTWLITPSKDWGPSDLSERQKLNQQYSMGPSAYGNPGFVHPTYSSAQTYPTAPQNPDLEDQPPPDYHSVPPTDPRHRGFP